MSKHKSDDIEAGPSSKRLLPTKSVKKKRLLKSNNFDLIYSLPYETRELIFKHISGKKLVDLCKVSKSWNYMISSSHEAMKKVVFRFENDSKEIIRVTSRKYEHIKVKQEYANQESEFLSMLSKFTLSWKSLSFEGIFDEEGIGNFFDTARFNIGTSGSEFKLKDLTFIGDVSKIDLFLIGFASLLNFAMDPQSSLKFNSITFSELPTETFANVLKNVKAKKLVLRNMQLKKLRLLDFDFSVNGYQLSVEKIHLSLTKIDKESMESLLEFCVHVTTVESCDWNYIGRKIRRVVEDSDKIAEDLPMPKVCDLMLQIPHELHELFLQHIPHDDLVSFSTVSKTWLNFTNDHIAKETMFTLKWNSQRRTRLYQNVSCVIRERMISLSPLIDLSATLQEIYIEIKPNSFNNVQRLFSSYRFPQLVLLNLTCHENEPLEDLILPNKLKALVLSNFVLTCDSFKETKFFEFLQRATDLENLQLYDCYNLDKMFLEDISPYISFNLNVLRFPIHKRRYTPVVSQNFNNFLNLHSELGELYLIKTDVKTVCNLIKKFKLGVLGFMDIKGDVFDLSKNLVSETLIHLQTPFYNLKQHKPYFALAPNLRTIHIRRLDDEIFEYATSNFKALKEIRYAKNELQKFINVQTDIELIEEDLAFEEVDEQVIQNIDAMADQNEIEEVHEEV